MVDDRQKRIIQAIVNVFETGTAKAVYDSVVVEEGAAGHLTYGHAQTTLASGNLYILIGRYCATRGARFTTECQPFLERLKACDLTLDDDDAFKDLLQRAGADAVMRATQDAFLDDLYWTPAVFMAEQMGITTPLGYAVVYDSAIHGNWHVIRDRTNVHAGTMAQIGEKAWLSAYMQVRRASLAASSGLLPTTVFRMDDLLEQANANNWDLKLPFVVHGVRIDEEAIAPP